MAVRDKSIARVSASRMRESGREAHQPGSQRVNHSMADPDPGQARQAAQDQQESM